MQTDAGWQKRWLVVHKSEIAVFETPGGVLGSQKLMCAEGDSNYL